MADCQFVDLSISPALATAARPLAFRHQRPRPDLAVLAVSGEVDLMTAPMLADELAGQWPPVLVLDLSGVGFFSLSGLAVLLAAADQARGSGRLLALAACSSPVRRVLSSLGPLPRLPVFGTSVQAAERLTRLAV